MSDDDTPETCAVDVMGRTIYVSGAVCIEMAHAVIAALEDLDAADGSIRIVLNSSGGEEQSGYAIYDAITMCRNHVTIDGFGSVASIAAAIFQAGDVRRLAPNAELMVHGGVLAPGIIQQSEVMGLAAQVLKGNERYHSILARASSQTVETVADWCSTDTYFDAQDAVDMGLADSILEPLKYKPVKKQKRRRKR